MTVSTVLLMIFAILIGNTRSKYRESAGGGYTKEKIIAINNTKRKRALR
jgi:hypothetical protein